MSDDANEVAVASEKLWTLVDRLVSQAQPFLSEQEANRCGHQVAQRARNAASALDLDDQDEDARKLRERLFEIADASNG